MSISTNVLVMKAVVLILYTPTSHILGDGERGRCCFEMHYAGLEGEDAVASCKMLKQLFDVLEVPDLGRWLEAS